MTLPEIQELLKEVSFEGYSFSAREGHGGWYLQAVYTETCIASGEYTTQYTRKWLLSPEMVKSEIVQTAFKCVATSMEHRAREGFLYKGKRIFGPHFDVDALWQVCDDGGLDYRGKHEAVQRL